MAEVLTKSDREVLEATRAVFLAYGAYGEVRSASNWRSYVAAVDRLSALIYDYRGAFRAELRHLLDGHRLKVELLDGDGSTRGQQALFGEAANG